MARNTVDPNLNGLTKEEVTLLSAYNSEQQLGLTPTQEWGERMANLQARWQAGGDEWFKAHGGERIEGGWTYSNLIRCDNYLCRCHHM